MSNITVMIGRSDEQHGIPHPVHCKDIAEASNKVRDFIEQNDLTAGCGGHEPFFTGGKLFADDAKTPLGHISYNGRVWDMNGKEIVITATEYTPGPWHVSDITLNQNHVFAEDGYQVADCEHYHISKRPLSEQKANAKLIAAAPDMAEALRLIEIICTESAHDCRKRMGTRAGNTLVAARAALAKADIT